VDSTAYHPRSNAAIAWALQGHQPVVDLKGPNRNPPSLGSTVRKGSATGVNLPVVASGPLSSPLAPTPPGKESLGACLGRARGVKRDLTQLRVEAGRLFRGMRSDLDALVTQLLTQASESAPPNPTRARSRRPSPG
jgi:hypothetical protein